MPEDIYGDYYGGTYEEPVGPLEAVYSAPAAAATEYGPLDLSNWDFGAFKALHNNPTGQANAEAINKYIADQAAQGKTFVSMNPYQGGGLDAINANIWNSYNQFDPNRPGATTGEVFRFDIGSNKGTAPAVLSEGSNYVLTDASGEKVLGTANTPEGMKALIQKANDQKYGWNLYEGTPEGGYTKGTQLFGESDPRVDGVLGALINYGVPIVTGIATGGASLLPSIAIAGGTTAAARLATGYDLGDALKYGAIAGGTAGLLNAPVLGGGQSIGGALGNAVSKVPGVGEALQEVGGAIKGAFAPAVGEAAAQAGAQQLAQQAANEIVVNAAKNLVPGVISSGLSGAASSLVPNIVTNPATGELSLARQPEPAPQPAEPTGGLDALAPEDIVVTAGRTPLDLPGVVAPAVSTAVTNPQTGELAVKSQELTQEQRQPEAQEEAASPNEIVVTGKTTPLDVSGALNSAVSNLLPPVVVNPPVEDLAVKPAEQPAEQTDQNEIVVTGKTAPIDLSGAAGGVLSTFAPEVVTNPITNELAVKTAEKPAEQPAEQADQNEILVTGNKTPLDLSGVAGSVASSFVPQVVTNPITNELAVKPGETVQEQVEDTSARPDDIVVTGNTGASTIDNLVSGALSTLAPSAVTPTDKLVEGPLSQETTQETTQEEQPGEDIVVKGNIPKPIEDLISSVGAVVPPLNTVNIPADAGNVTPKEDKGGLSTLDKIRLAAAALGGLGGAAAGGSKGATMPGGFGLDPSFSKQLPIPGVGGAFAVGGLGPNTLPGIGGVVPPGGDYTKFGMGNATRAVPTAIPQYGGVNPPGFNTQTWEWLGPQSAPAKNIIDQLSVLPTSAAPVAAEEPVKKAMGGYAVGGPGDGRSDEIPAMLSDGEYVIDAETVALLGNGSNKAGAKQLDKFRANIRKHKGRELARGKFSVKAKEPSAYLSGGR